MKKIGLMFILVSLLNACSFSNANKEEVVSRPSDELEFAVDTLNDTISTDEQMLGSMPDAEVAVGEPETPLVVEGQAQIMAAPEEPKMQDYQRVNVASEVTPVVTAEDASREPVSEPKSNPGTEAKYQMQKGDTLMMVAFKIYGDYRKWKDLKAWNQNALKNRTGPGAVLKYYVPDQVFGWQPSGLPYMIKTGDNLGMISMEKYGTSKKWKNIYENNRPLIRDPNLIFAGFTIYYVPVRDVASEKR